MLKLNLNIEETKVELTSPDGLSATTYTLREMSAKERDAYMQEVTSRMSRGPDGKPTGLAKFDGLQTELLCHCLYDTNDKLVDKATIDQWPAKVVAALHTEAQRLNGLGKEKEEPSKKDSAE